MPPGSINKYGTLRAEKISVNEIVIPNTSIGNVGTLKLSDNLEIGGDGMILHDLEEFIAGDNGTYNYLDSEGNTTDTGIATIAISEGETSTNTFESNNLKNITTPTDITLNSKTFSITQSGTTVTIDQTETKKIISLEQGNLVLATYNTETGARSNKEVIFDSNNSIGEINNASYDLTVRSLSMKPHVITTVSTTIGSPTNLSIIDADSDTVNDIYSVLYFDLDSTSAMYASQGAGIDGQQLNIFYDNNESDGSLRIDFGSTGGGVLRTGNGNNQYLTFTITGQSATLMYISTVSKWCVMNTGAGVS